METIKAISYHVRINPNGSGTVVINNGDEEQDVADIPGAINLPADELDNRAKLTLKVNDVEIIDPTDADYMTSQKSDLRFVRQKMKAVLKELCSNNTTLSEKKDKLDVYQQACSAAQVITNICKLELQFENIGKNKKF